MKYSFFFLLIVCVGCRCNLDQWARNSDFEKITTWRAKQKYDWNKNWQLDSCSAEQIDHYLEGVNLYWSIQEDSITYTRSESFNLDGTFYSGNEYTIINDTVRSNTTLRFRPDRSLYFKKIAYWEGEYSSNKRTFILDIYDQDKIISSYSSKSYYIDLSHFKFDYSIYQKPKDLKLISGKDVIIETNK